MSFIYVKMIHNILYEIFIVFCAVTILCVKVINIQYIYDLFHILLAL